MALGLFLKIVGTVAELFLPLIMAHMIDDVAPTRSVPALVWWSVGMLLVAVAAWAGNVFANRIASRVARDTTQRLRGDLFAKTLSLSARQADAVTLPSLVSRLSTDTYNVHNMVGMMQRIGVRAPILLVGGVALTFTVDPVLALVMLVTVPLLALISALVAKKGFSLYTRLQASTDAMVRKVRDDHTGVRVIKALSRAPHESAAFSEVNRAIVHDETKASLTTGLTNPVMNAVLNLGMAAVIFLGAYRAAEGRVQVGEILAFTSFFTIMLNAVIAVGRIFVELSKGSASAKRIESVLALPADLLPVPCPADESGASIRFDDVTLTYGGAPALEHVSFAVGRGETLGILGATGSGKSSLVSLLLRFYDADAGAVYVDGANVKSYEPAGLRQKFGVVFQNDFLMASSVRENIDFERGLAPGAVQRAAGYARADGFIGGHGGYESELTARGANFSGGQKQRLLIARALAAAPEILVLDDSSSALDYKTDAALRKTLLQELRGTTVVLIAQRISSVRFADKILVLDGGRAVGFGSDAELMQNCAAYRAIYASQHGEEDGLPFADTEFAKVNGPYAPCGEGSAQGDASPCGGAESADKKGGDGRAAE